MIELKNITKIYGENKNKFTALNNVNLTIKKGEFLSIVGKSGSGKSTLLNIIGCMDYQTNGSYFFDNKDISLMKYNQLAHFRGEKIGFVFQNFNLVSDLTVFENVEMPLGYMKIKSKQRKERVNNILESVGLQDKINNFPSQLSGGQQQRVAIARALVTNPTVILADEPTGNLDSENSMQIMDLFKEIHRLHREKIIIMITHGAELSKMADRILKIRDGRLLYDENEL